MNPRPYDGVLFDLDGTLLDSVGLIVESYRHVLRENGLPERSEAEILEGLGTLLEDQFRRWVDSEAEVARLSAAYIEHNLRVHDSLVAPFAGVNAIVERLALGGVPLGIVTSKRRDGALKGLAALGLKERFGVIVCGDEVKHPKPHPEPVRRALLALELDPERAVFVGDSTHDIESGKAAGAQTIGVTWGSGTREALANAAPDALVDDAAGLAAALHLG